MLDYTTEFYVNVLKLGVEILNDCIPDEVIDWLYDSAALDIGRQVREGWKFSEFISRSAGRSRRRKPRGLILVTTPTGVTYSFRDDGRIPKHRANISLDSLAQEALSDVSFEDRTVETLIHKLRSESRKRV